MRRDGHVRERAANLRLDPIDEFVSPFDRPVARHQNVERHEPPRAGAACPKGMVFDAVAHVRLKHRHDRLDLVRRQGGIHEAVHRRLHDPRAGEHDIGRHGQREQRIEPVPPRERHRTDAHENAC